jgi:hypothetical protein
VVGSGYPQPIRIHAFDFTYTVNQMEIFRLLIENGDNNSGKVYEDIIVLAFGGTNTSYYQPYGDQFMGERRFERIMNLKVCPLIYPP